MKIHYDRARGSLVLPIPLNGYMAQVVVPVDISSKEAKKLCAALRTLPIPKPKKRDQRGRFA